MNKKQQILRILFVFLGVAGILILCCACHSPADQVPTESSTDEEANATTDEFMESVSYEENEMETNMENLDNLTSYRVTDVGGEEGLDFIIDFPTGKDVTILQITDTQMQTMAGVRNELRKNQVGNAFFAELPDDFEFRVWRYVDEAVERSAPDLIVLTGDNIYGELDDSGEMWLALIQKMDSYGIPWCTVFGNHDNESGKGVQWQVDQLLASEYCIFRQGTVTGNSNYNLLIRQGGKTKYLLYMMDSNGCETKPENPGEGMMPDNVDIDKICQTAGFGDDQLKWLRTSANSIHAAYGKVPVLLFYHIPAIDIARMIYRAYPAGYTLPFSPDREGDLGMAKEIIGGVASNRFWKTAKFIGCTGMFVGHQHKVAVSVLCDGVRVTYGLKTGTYDYHDEEMLGATKIMLPESGGDFQVEYLYSALPYKESP